MPIEPMIVQKPGFIVVGMAISTSALSNEIPALWGVFGPRIDEVTGISEPQVSYGIMEHFDVRKNALDYMAAVPVASIENTPHGMVGRRITAQTYAVFNATLNSLGEVFGYIFNQWLPNASHEQVPAPYFERYDESFDPSKAESVVEIYIPVKPRRAQPAA
jgi:AraC family transcriptional regulator